MWYEGREGLQVGETGERSRILCGLEKDVIPEKDRRGGSNKNGSRKYSLRKNQSFRVEVKTKKQMRKVSFEETKVGHEK